MTMESRKERRMGHARERWREMRFAAMLIGDRAGAAVVEFALVLPVFLLFLLGVVEFGRALWTDHALQFAVEQASRYVIANPTASDSQILGYVGSQLATVDPADVTITVNRDTASGVDFVTVTASYPFSPMSPIVDTPMITLSARSRVPLTS